MIPDYQTLMRLILEACANGEVSTLTVIDQLADRLQLTDEERAIRIPSGQETMLYNRVHWARTYMKQAGLLTYTRRGHFEISDSGREALASGSEINTKFLRNYHSFREFESRNKKPAFQGREQSGDTPSTSTPDELIRAAYDEINQGLAAELIARIAASPPAAFELLIIDLFVAMGYGGTADSPGKSLGRSGDDGIDGVIDQDPLGVDQIYLQAKRYRAGNSVGSGSIRDFYGSLNLKKAHKGIFVTTSTFTASAEQTARELGSRIVLIDGMQLAKLMIRYSIGCRDEQVLHLKKVDEEYFEASALNVGS